MKITIIIKAKNIIITALNARWTENLARAGIELWEEAFNFPDSFVTFLIREKSNN